MKAVSPLVATVLLIAFVVAVAGIVSIWATGFAREQTELVESQSETSITCQYGKVSMRNLNFEPSSTSLAGVIENNGQIGLGNMRLSVIYQNASSQTISLCKIGTGSASCATPNLTMGVGDQTTFNVTIWGGNYDSVRLSTNCTTASFTAERGDIS